MFNFDLKEIATKLVDGKWDEQEFTIGKTSFKVERIGAMKEDAILDDFFEELGLRGAQELKFLFTDIDLLKTQALIQLFLKLSKEYKRRLRDVMFTYTRYKHHDGEQFKPIRTDSAVSGRDELEADAFQYLRGGHVQLVFWRSLWSTFRDSFSDPV